MYIVWLLIVKYLRTWVIQNSRFQFSLLSFYKSFVVLRASKSSDFMALYTGTIRLMYVCMYNSSFHGCVIGTLSLKYNGAPIYTVVYLLYVHCSDLTLQLSSSWLRYPIVCKHSCRWFRLGKNIHTGCEEWQFTGSYWKRDWSTSPDIFWRAPCWCLRIIRVIRVTRSVYHQYISAYNFVTFELCART